MPLLVLGVLGGAALLNQLAAVEREGGSAALKLAGAALLAGGAYYLYRRAR